jgi:hypothetical protein
MASLELVFSDVWSPAPTSIGKNNYYVSFIDDFSKFTWVYLLKHKSKVFQKFQDFQARVERLFDQKLLAMQTNWGGGITTLVPFLNMWALLIWCPAHIRIDRMALLSVNTDILLRSALPFLPMPQCCSNFMMRPS